MYIVISWFVFLLEGLYTFILYWLIQVNKKTWGCCKLTQTQTECCWICWMWKRKSSFLIVREVTVYKQQPRDSLNFKPQACFSNPKILCPNYSITWEETSQYFKLWDRCSCAGSRDLKCQSLMVPSVRDLSKWSFQTQFNHHWFRQQWEVAVWVHVSYPLSLLMLLTSRCGYCLH